MKLFTTMEHGAKHQKVVFLMGGLTYRLFFLWPVAKILALNGFHCITYCYSLNIFTPDFVKTRQNLLTVTDDVVKRIDSLKKQGKGDFAMVGTSLGTILSVMVANRVPEVRKLVLNTTSSETAKTVWSWDDVKAGFKLALLNKNVTLPRLAQEWKSISIIYNINKFKGKKVLVYLAKRDNITPYKYGLEQVRAMRQKGAKCQVYTNKYLGHSLAGVLNLIKSRQYLDFLKHG